MPLAAKMTRIDVTIEIGFRSLYFLQETKRLHGNYPAYEGKFRNLSVRPCRFRHAAKRPSH